jgi:hypothetical protein
MGHILKILACGIMLILWTSCASHSFHPLGPAAYKFAPLPETCPVEFRFSDERPPELDNAAYIGGCDVKIPGGGVIRDATSDLYPELRKCACSVGGNFVHIVAMNERNIGSWAGPSQQWVTATGGVYKTKD